ncbi:MAG: 2-amino-4-hydroxy-6-hydroxymethyldihydropteridine diphosphokinase [Candidatus Omnitrophica bacterium]|nr:2-amino-4-hydroxy-6-hydroxymethyldihydropteridine diphosphokinase [Candidatus Omnitrophota bacterium]
MRKKVSYIGLGSNLGDRLVNINKAIEYLKENQDITVEKVSSIIETEPQGGPPQGKFLNAVVKIKTSLAPQDLLRFLQDIEAKLGRTRLIRNGPRTIDLDILLYDNKVIDEPNLEVPHPRMFERDFVLKPLLEIEPDIFDKLEGLKPYRDKLKFS